MRSLRVIEVMITLIISFEFNFSLRNGFESKVSYDDNYCKKICQNFRYCNRICSERVRNPSTDSISLPHCGLTQLNRRTVGVNSRKAYAKESKANRYPWMVSIQVKSGLNLMTHYNLRKHLCGGAIINSRFILTSAVCCVFEGEYEIKIGSNSIRKDDTNGIIFKNLTNIIHEKFIYEKKPLIRVFNEKDICLIKTRKPIEFIIKENVFVVNSICLPERDSEQYGEALIAGWGVVKQDPKYIFLMNLPENIHQDMYILFDKQSCSVIYKDMYYENSTVPVFENKTQICTVSKFKPDRGHGFFTGGIGSPVIQYESNRAYVIGVVNGESREVPTVLRHIQVSKYINWIESTINKYS